MGGPHNYWDSTGNMAPKCPFRNENHSLVKFITVVSNSLFWGIGVKRGLVLHWSIVAMNPFVAAILGDISFGSLKRLYWNLYWVNFYLEDTDSILIVAMWYRHEYNITFWTGNLILTTKDKLIYVSWILNVTFYSYKAIDFWWSKTLI